MSVQAPVRSHFDIIRKKETALEIEVDSDTSSRDPEPVNDDKEMEYKKGDNVEIYVNESNWTEAYVKESIDIQKNVAIGFLLAIVVAWIIVEIIWFIRRKKSEKQ